MSEVRIPILDLRAQYATIATDVQAAIHRVIESQHFILGPEVEAFEREVAAYLGVRHAIGVASGTDALALSLMALGVGPGDGVITTPMTYFATAETIARVGAQPIFVDVKDEDLNLDPELVERAFKTSPVRVRAVMPVHLYGRACDIEAILAIARKHDAFVIEDTAQALGAKKNGRHAGTFGDLGCYSFFPSKNLGAFGDGGLITAERDDLGERLKRLRVHGQKARYMHDELGLNSRLDAVQAAILRVKLPHLDTWNQGRRERVRAYRKAFEGAPVRCMPEDGDGREDIFHLCVVRVPAHKRDGLAPHLAKHGIQAIVHYPKALHEQPVFTHLGYKLGDFPVTEAACREVISLPLYPELSDAAVAEIAGLVRDFVTAP